MISPSSILYTILTTNVVTAYRRAKRANRRYAIAARRNQRLLNKIK